MVGFHSGRKVFLAALVQLFSSFIAFFPFVPQRSTVANEVSTPTEQKGGDAGDRGSMSRKTFRTLGGGKAKGSKSRASALQFEHLESRLLFSATPVNLAVPLEAASPAAVHQAPALGLQGGSVPPLDVHWGTVVLAGADFSVGAYVTAQLNAELIGDGPANAALQWSQVSGPGHATFSNPAALNSTVQFDTAGSYVLNLTATIGAVTKSDQLMVSVTAANVINIDQAWLTAQGPGPYYLNQQGKTYVLQTDVATPGTAFAITAANVTFDLNGHKITYDNAAPITVPNGGFETGSGTSATGWDFTGSSNVAVAAGSFLNDEVYGGAKSLKFSDTTTSTHVVSTGTVTLLANTTYSLSAMFDYGGGNTTAGLRTNPGVVGYVSLVGTGGEPIRTVSFSGSNNRGIQLTEAYFTTDGTDETYHIQVGITGHSPSAYPFYIDDLKIQRTGCYGVAVGAWTGMPLGMYPDITQSGTATNAVVKNGTIVQGQDNGTWCHGIRMMGYSGATGHTISGLNITVGGADSSPIFYYQPTAANSKIFNNTLTSNVLTVTTRDHGDASMIFGAAGDIYNNVLTGGPTGGINTTFNGISNIYGNTISLKARYTNANAIAAGFGSQIHDNIINCGTGVYNSRGIDTWGNTGDLTKPTTRIYNNTIAVQGNAINQEYGGVTGFGVYGIQIESANNVEVYGNTVTAYGVAGEAGFAFRANSDTPGASGSLYVHDNSFIAVSDGTTRAASVKMTTMTATMVRFEDNTLVTNDGIVGLTADTVLKLTRSHITVNTPIANSHPFDKDFGVNPTPPDTALSFVDTVFQDSASRTYFESAICRNSDRYGGAPMNWMAFDEQWTTTIQVKDAGGAALANAQVTITNAQGTQVFSGVSNANGQVVAVLTAFQTQGGTKTSYNSFTAMASINGQQIQQQFTADKVQTVNVQMPVPSGSADAPANDGAASSIRRLSIAEPLVSLPANEVPVISTTGANGTSFLPSGEPNIYFQIFARAWSVPRENTIFVGAQSTKHFGAVQDHGNGRTIAIEGPTAIQGGAHRDRESEETIQDMSLSSHDNSVLAQFDVQIESRDIVLEGNTIAS